MPPPSVDPPRSAPPAGPVELKDPGSPRGATGASPSDPLPVGTSSSAVFTYTGQWTRSTFDGRLFGIVESIRGPRFDSPGRCFTVLGSLTPTEIVGAVAHGNDTPQLSLRIGGETVESRTFACESEDAEREGFDEIVFAQVTAGTEYPFTAHVFVPGGASIEPDLIVVSGAGGDDLYFEAPVLDHPPAVSPTTADPSGIEIAPANDPNASGFTTTNEIRRTRWDGFVFGLVEAPYLGERDRRCVLVLLAVTSLRDAPDPGPIDPVPRGTVIAGGEDADEGLYSCDTTEAERAGFVPSGLLQVPTGATALVFNEQLLHPEQFDDLQLIAIGLPDDGSALYYEPLLLDSAPTLCVCRHRDA